jgi:hypothetical protein
MLCLSFPKEICISRLSIIGRNALAVPLFFVAITLSAQQTPQPAPVAPAQSEPAPPKGKVIFQREEKQPELDAPDSDAKAAASATGESSSQHSDTQTPAVPDADVTVSDEEREAAMIHGLRSRSASCALGARVSRPTRTSPFATTARCL